jgi:NADPH:quinone reductase-like Zn-dependent oxidoreductase
LRRADPFLVRLVFGFFKPRKPVLGVDFAGEVESVGSSVTDFAVGDRVFGSSFGSGMAAHAEYVCVPEDGVVTKLHGNLSFEDAASLYFGANTALHFLRKGEIAPGMKVLVYGASGAVGSYAVQLARHFGAEVHGVCSTRNIDRVRELGADRVFDYTKEDFSRAGETYDIIFDTVGKSPFGASLKVLAAQGAYLRAVHMAPGPMLHGLWAGLVSDKRVIAGVAAETKTSLEYIRDLADDGELRPVIDKIYPFEEIVEAHRHVDTGHKRGSVVVKIR